MRAMVAAFTWALSGRRRASDTIVPRESFRIDPLLRHRMIAVTDCDILEASTPELDDVVRLEDRYGRAK